MDIYDEAIGRGSILLEHAEILAQVHQRGALIVQLEPYALARARILAASLNEVVDLNRTERGGLITRQLRPVENGIAIGSYAHEVLHVGETDLGQLGDDALGRHFELVRDAITRLLD